MITYKKRGALTDENFFLMAAKWYDTVSCVQSEFEHDCSRFKYIKKLLRKYKKTGEIRERLVLNHIIILGNVFGIEQSIRMLYLKIEPEDWDVLKTFLISIEQNLPMVHNINGEDVVTAGIRVDMKLADKLRQINNDQ